VKRSFRVARAARVTAAVAVLGLVAACSGSVAGGAYGGRPGSGSSPSGARASSARPLPVALTRVTSAAVSVQPDTGPVAVTTEFARKLYASAPIVVVAAADGTKLPTAVRQARAIHAPLLLAPAAGNTGKTSASAEDRLAAGIQALHPVAVLSAGLQASATAALARRLPGIRVVSRAADLPPTGDPASLRGVTVLIRASAKAARSVPVIAVTATAKAAGATVVDMAGTDPRADPAVIKALARLKPGSVIAVGEGFGSVGVLKARLAVAETGGQLPGGGQVMFPGRRLVALYGSPQAPSLGVLGHQDLQASIARAKEIAAEYRPLSSVPVVPAFEIIATVAEGSPGPDGSYSYETPVADLLPWVRAATKAGLYVVLDLQSGRASLLKQAKDYQKLLALPGVGLALDPEWRLLPGQRPLKQIGHVDITEVNSVINWLAALTARDRLPQKLLVLHQFLLSMITGEQNLDTSHDDLSILIHMDGQGTPGNKQATWNAVTAAAPPRVFFGWKNFLVMDHPMLSPGETMTKAPAPVMISYQ
jgi:voltage-gated potassium channel Kch